MRAYHCSDGEWCSCCLGIEHGPVMGLMFVQPQSSQTTSALATFHQLILNSVSVELTVLILLLFEDAYITHVPIVV